MRTIIKTALLASMFLIHPPEKRYSISLTVAQWNLLFNTLEYRKAILIHSSDPSYIVTPVVDSLSLIEGEINFQITREMADTVGKKK